jgi:hypothetical protein
MYMEEAKHMELWNCGRDAEELILGKTDPRASGSNAMAIEAEGVTAKPRASVQAIGPRKSEIGKVQRFKQKRRS